MRSFYRLIAASLALSVVAACHRQPAVDEHIAHMSAADLKAQPGANVASQGVAGLPPSGSQALARLESTPRHGEWVKVAWEPGSRDSLMAWIVYPSTTNAKSPVVVVIHENTGLIPWVRSVADQAAAEGFIAIAPDLLSRVRGGPSTELLARDSVSKIISGVNSVERNRGIAAVARYAMSQPSAAPRYAVIGYCWGGSTTWMHAVNGGISGFVGGVAFYGLPPGTAPFADSLAKVKVPVMLLNGSKDARIGSAMPTVDSVMKALGKSYVGKNYEGAVHGFLRAQADPRPQNRDEAEEQANLAATKDAWPRTVEFLKKNLGVK
jgi:carboxymethylenebutenolidase